MPKCGLCDFGAKRAPTAPLERLGAFGPLRTPKNVGHVCKSAKVIFCNFIFIFSKNKKVTKSHFRTFAYVYDVFWCSEGSKRSKSLKWRRWSSFRSKMTQAALFHTCPTFFDVFGVPKRVLGAQNAFRRHFCTSAPQNHQETSDTYDKSAGSPNSANF